MKTKKLIAMLCAITLLSTIIALPVSAAEPSMFTKDIINDTFDSSLGNWKLGTVASSTTGYSLELDTFDGATVMKFVDTVGYGNPGSLPNISNFLDKPLSFTDNSKVTVKTRFYHTGNPSGSGIVNLKINRPDTGSWYANNASGTQQNETGMEWYNVFRSDGTSFRYMKTATNTATSLTNVSSMGKWVEVELSFDGTADGDPEDVIITAKYDGQTYQAIGTVKQYMDHQYNIAGYTESVFDSIKNFTWLIRAYANTLYVDYFQIIEERPFITASAALEENYIRTTDPLRLTFTADADITTMPEGAVYIDGVDADVTYDKETKTVALQPKAELAPGAHHTVMVNSAILGEEEGIIFEGATEFDFDVSDVSASALVATGRVIPGTVITSSYIYSSSKPEGTHRYQWQMSETGEEGTFTDIVGATAKDFTVTENEYGKYLRFEMIPYGLDEEGNNTYYGFETYSNVIIPEKVPVASNVAVSTSTLFANIYLSALYDYSDENGDSEGATEVRWYTSDAADGEWNEVHVGATYYIEDTDVGKYIKCAVTPIANSDRESRGVTEESPVVGPVDDLLASTNLFTNPGFEDGELGDWKAVISTAWEGIKIQNKDVYEGNYGLQLLASRQSVNESYGQEINVTSGKTYVLGVWAKKTGSKLQDVQSFTPYCFNGNVASRGDSTGQYEYSLTDRWTHVVGSFIANSSGKARFGAVSFVARESGLEAAYLDNFYLGEAVIADIETYEQEPITIPESGSTSVAVTSGKALNQLGTQHGLWNEKVVVSIPETEGVYVDGNNIIVTDTAVKSSFVAEIYCIPSYAGASQAIFQKFVEIDIVPHNDPAPRITSIDANGTVNTGATLTGEYTFYQVDGKADASEIRWMYSDSENGVYYDIPGANALTYTVEAEYADKYIKMAVLPKTDDGLAGTEVRSEPLTMARVPVASNVSVSGDFSVGGTLTGSYTYYDPNKDAEGTTTFKWYVADSANGTYTAIPGATASTFTFTADLVNKYIKFGVTPVSSVAPATGAEVISEAYAGPAAPVAMNVTITQDETRLVGNYDFYHVHNARETDTVYKWTIDGVVVSNEIDYVIGFTGTKTVTFTVTPVADSNPARGASVSVSATVTGNPGVVGGNTPVGGVVIGGGAGGSGGSGGGGGGGSSSGGGSFTSGVTSVNDMQLGSPEEKKEENNETNEPTSDIEGHWGEEYIEEMVSRGVMSADENGNYNPDELVGRKDMLTYLFKTLGLEASEYEGVFEDVEDGEFAGMLQTMVNNGTIAVDTHFRPGDDISREEMCKILYISLDNAGKLEKIEDALIEAFEDFDSISEWAREYVNAIYGNKIMIGVSDTHFAAQESLTKAQAATLLTRIIKLIEGEE